MISHIIILHILVSCPSLFSPWVFSPWIRLGLFSWLRFLVDTLTMFSWFQVGMENLIVWCLVHAPHLNCGVSINKFRADNLRLAPYKTINMNRKKLSPSETDIRFCFNNFLLFEITSQSCFLLVIKIDLRSDTVPRWNTPVLLLIFRSGWMDGRIWQNCC